MFAWPQNLRVASNHVSIALLHYLKKKRVHHHNFSLIYLPLWILKCIFLMKYIHYVCKMRVKCKTNSVPLTALCSLTISTSKRKRHVWKVLCVLWREGGEYVRRPELFWTWLHTHCFLSPASTQIISQKHILELFVLLPEDKKSLFS